MRIWLRDVRDATRGMPPLRGVLPLLVALVAWQLLQQGPSPYYPAPSQWWRETWPLIAGRELGPALSATLQTFAAALVLATALGGAAGVLIGMSRRTRRAVGPLLEFLRTIPPPAVVPLAVLFLGYDERMKLLVVTFAAVWPILLNTSSAVTHIDPLLTDVARSLRMSRADRVRKIVVPAAVPGLLLGVRIALPLAVIVTLLVEMLISAPGVGSLVVAAQRSFQSARVFGLLVLVGLVGFVLNAAFVVIEGLIMRRWPPRPGASA
jgi:ABC-type nitrate/sulfonate/bicarbonate transport system permease component